MPSEDPTPESADVQTVSARNVSVLDCFAARECDGRKRLTLAITFGSADGAVDSVALSRDEGYRLMRTLLQKFKVQGSLGDPAVIHKKFCIPHSIYRAKIDLRLGTQKMFESLMKDIPEIAEYVRAELDSLERTLRRCCREKTRVDRIVERVKAAILVAVDAARIDT